MLNAKNGGYDIPVLKDPIESDCALEWLIKDTWNLEREHGMEEFAPTRRFPRI